MAAMGVPPTASMEAKERILRGAGSFTGLWALTWLGAQAVGVSHAVQGGFAVGGVMASSGLTVLWWKYSAMRDLEPGRAKRRDDAFAAPEDPDEEPAEDEDAEES